MRCVVCGAKDPEGKAYVEYSRGNIKLKRCERCGNVVDKYVEFEALVIALDILLHKREAYRHVLFNRESQRKVYSNVWAFVFVCMLEFYLRIYYATSGRTPSAQLGATLLLKSVVYNGVSVLLAYAIATLFVRSTPCTCLSPLTCVEAVLLGSSIKALFLMMSIWTYPKLLVAVLRLLSLSCTAISLSAALENESSFPCWSVAALLSAIQSFDGGLLL